MSTFYLLDTRGLPSWDSVDAAVDAAVNELNNGRARVYAVVEVVATIRPGLPIVEDPKEIK